MARLTARLTGPGDAFAGVTSCRKRHGREICGKIIPHVFHVSVAVLADQATAEHRSPQTVRIPTGMALIARPVQDPLHLGVHCRFAGLGIGPGGAVGFGHGYLE